MSAWRVASWSRTEARGDIASEHFPTPLPFDGSIALVDDFQIGEEVEVEVVRAGDTTVVRKIWPVVSRPNPAQAAEKPLPTTLESRLRQANCALREKWLHGRIAAADRRCLTIQADDDYGRRVLVLRFASPTYIQAPVCIEFRDEYSLRAYRWPNFRQHNPERVSTWSVEPEWIPEVSFVFAFESRHFGSPTPLLCAADLEVWADGASVA